MPLRFDFLFVVPRSRALYHGRLCTWCRLVAVLREFQSRNVNPKALRARLIPTVIIPDFTAEF